MVTQWRAPLSPEDRRKAAKRTAWKRGLGIAGACAALFFGVPLFLHLRALQHDKEGPGELEVARLGKLADGRAVVLVVANVVHPDSEGPDTERTRMDVIDAQSGARLVRKPRMEMRDCVPAAAGLAFCIEEKNRLAVYDLATLTVVKSAGDLEKDVPALSKGIHEDPQVDPVEGSAIVMTNDASIWSIASAGCRARCAAKEIPKKDSAKLTSFFSRMGYAGATAKSPFGEVKLADGRVIGFTGDAKKSLTIGRSGDMKPLGVATFLEPRLVVINESPGEHEARRESDSGTFRFGSEELIIVAHADSLDAEKAKQSLTAFDLEGRTKWTQQVGGGTLEHGFRAGETIIFAVAALEGGYVFGLSLRDGRIVWRQPT